MNDPNIIIGVSDELPSLLRTKRFGRELRWLSSVGSTNAEAISWAAEEAPEGALVGTDHQSAGRGRHGRAWSDSPGHNLLFSLVLHPTLSPDYFGLIPLAAGLAVAEAIELHTPFLPTLKWPNDVLIAGRKVCGILLEGQLSPKNGSRSTMVLGIGLNVNQTEFPSDVSSRATSLALETGQFLPRLPLLADALLAIEKRYDSLLMDRGADILKSFEERMAGLGDNASISFPHSGNSALGTILGVAENGALRLMTDDGEQLFHAGEITFAGKTSFAD